jgi:uncharacterized membrane protein
MLKVISTVIVVLGISSMTCAQFIVKDSYYETTDVSNQGLVVGYATWAGPYSLWNPETQTNDTIYGIAPGNGVGGRAMFSADGIKISGTSSGLAGPEMSVYDYAMGTWTVLGSLGFSVDNTRSNGYAISGDGNTVVGNAWADTSGGLAYTTAIAWTQAEGIMDLGTLFPARSTRANAVSANGQVVVGWQDFNGPWKSAVWRKDPLGGFYVNEYLLVDNAGNPADEYNQLGECTAVSADGNWIGGYGDFATNGNPWIWSQATGMIDLGTLAAGATGYVAAINQDGSMAVGRFQQGPWDPELPFIWTPTGGIQNLNTYATTTLQLDLGTNVIYAANCMSSNGHYIVGYGIDTVSFAYITYRLSTEPLSIEENETVEVSIAPNPVQNTMTVKSEEAVTVQLLALNGDQLMQFNTLGIEQYDLGKLANGIYFLQFTTNDLRTKRIRIVKV